MSLRLFLLTSLVFASAFAQSSIPASTVSGEAKPLPLFGFDATVGARGRYQENALGNVTHKRLQYQGISNLWVNLSDQGCLKAKGQIATGAGYVSAWDNSSIGDADGEMNVSMRRLYLDMNCYMKQVSIQAGSMGAVGPGDLGLKEDVGWVDGVRAIVTVDKDRKLRVVITMGEVDEFNNPEFYNRQYQGHNYTQILVDGNITDRISFVTDITNHDHNQYVRAVLKLAVKDIVHVVDTFSIEEMILNGEQEGFMVSGEKAIGDWKIKLGFSEIEGDNLRRGTLNLPYDDFYVPGNNYQISITKSLDKTTSLRLRNRFGSGGSRTELSLVKKY